MCKMVRRFSESDVVKHTPRPETYRSISSPEELNCTDVCVKERSEQVVMKNSSKRKKFVIDSEQNYDIEVHERHKDDHLNSLMLGYIGLNTKMLESVSTFMCIAYQLILTNFNAKKDADSKNCCYGGKVKQIENSTIFNKSKAIFGSLDYLFGLQGFPTQIIHHFPAISLTTYYDSLSSGLSLPLDQSMSNNLLRIASFSNFPRHVNIFTSLLSKAGFYYTGNDDEVRCYACGITHKRWTSTDDPIKIHQELSPSCQHLISLTSDNIPIAHESPPQSEKSSLVGNSNNPNSSTLSIETTNSTLNSNTVSRENTLTLAQGQSFSSLFTNENCNGASLRQLDKNTTACQSGQIAPKKGFTPQTLRTNTDSTCQQIASNEIATNTQLRNETTSHVINSSQSGATGNDNLSHSQQSNGIDLPSMGIHLDKPRYPNYAPLQVRIGTFDGWPSYLDQTPRQMATAGFLFAGYQDYTRCFFCGGGLRNWEAGDDPWIEHARWFPKCTYLLQNKGPKFVNAVQAKQEQLEREQSRGASNNIPSLLQNAESSNSNNTDNHQSNSHLDTVAAKSVLEMGYSSDEVLHAIQLCNSSNPGTSVSAADIMSVILNMEDEGNTAAASRTESTSESVNTADAVTSTNIRSLIGNSENITLEGSILDDTELLLEANKQLRDQRLCKICLEFDACIAFLPCGHLVCCSDCAPAMRKCPICRAYVKGTVKTFLA